MSDGAQAGRLRQVAGARWVEVDTPDAEAVFASMLAVPEATDLPKGIDALFGALEIFHDTENAGFLRAEAGLAVIVIADGEDKSTGLSRAEVISYLQTLKASEGLVTFSSIIAPPQGCPGAQAPGEVYRQITQAVGGIDHDICDTAWTDVPRALVAAIDVDPTIRYLSALPVPESLSVRVEIGEVTLALEPSIDWVYDPVGNSVRLLEYVPQPPEVLVAEYALHAE